MTTQPGFTLLQRLPRPESGAPSGFVHATQKASTFEGVETITPPHGAANDLDAGPGGPGPLFGWITERYQPAAFWVDVGRGSASWIIDADEAALHEIVHVAARRCGAAAQFTPIVLGDKAQQTVPAAIAVAATAPLTDASRPWRCACAGKPCLHWADEHQHPPHRAGAARSIDPRHRTFRSSDAQDRSERRATHRLRRHDRSESNPGRFGSHCVLTAAGPEVALRWREPPPRRVRSQPFHGMFPDVSYPSG